MKCRETVTVTAPSGKAAEELFSKFEKGTSQPELSIPKWVADIFDEFLKDDYDWHDFEMSFVGVDDDDDGLERKFFDWTNSENATELTLAYLNPLTRAFVEVEG